MKHCPKLVCILALTALGFCGGCLAGKSDLKFRPRLVEITPGLSPSVKTARRPGCETGCDTNDVTIDCTETCEADASIRPLTRLSELPTQRRSLTLDEAIRVALTETEILRSLNATAVQIGQSAASIHDAAIQSTDPNFGVDAALSAFDATFNADVTYANNDDFFNNPTTTGGAFEVQQDLTNFNYGFNKTTAAGTQLRVGSVNNHSSTTNPSVLFPSSFTTQWEASARQPLLQGRGVLFNRITGPRTQPGFFGSTGLLISRTNQELSEVEFERSVREMISEIIDAYWSLDLAYRNLETVTAARDGALKTWNLAKARNETGIEGGEADREAEARQQYYAFESRLQRTLNSNQQDGSPGVLQSEANLRRLLRMPRSDGLLLSPVDKPGAVQIVIDWDQCSRDACSGRAELREQQLRIQRREMELLASKNFTLPRLDAIATYRQSGLGDDLINDSGKFSGALNEQLSGNYDEFEVGLACNIPIGFRQAHAGVRNAQLQLIRERSVLNEMQDQILYQLGTTLRQFDQSYNDIELAQLRADAAEDTVAARFAAYQADAVRFDELLDAQQQSLDARLELHRFKSESERIKSRLQAQSGQLLAEYQVRISESTTFNANRPGDTRAQARHENGFAQFRGR